MTERVGRAVLELATDQAQLQKDFDKLKKDFADIKQHVAGVDGVMQKLGSTIKTAMKAFVVTELLQMVKGFIDLTGNLTDSAAAAQMNTTEFQKLKHAAEQNGGSMELVTKGAQALAKNLVEGDKSTAAAVRRLGLDLDAVRNMRPAEAFALIGDKVAGIKNPMEQSAIAMQLFGKSGADLLPMLKGNFVELGEAAEKSGLILSEEVVAAGDDFGDTLGQLATLGMALIGNVLAPFLPLLNQLAQDLVKVAQVVGMVLKPAIEVLFALLVKWRDFLVGLVQGFLDFAMKIPGASTVVSGLKTAFEALKKGAIDLHTSLVPVKEETTKVATAGAKLPPVFTQTKVAVAEAAESLKLFAKHEKLIAEANEQAAKTQHMLTIGRLEAINAIREQLTWGERERALLDATTQEWLELTAAMNAAMKLEGVFAFGKLGIAANAQIGEQLPIPIPPEAPKKFWAGIMGSPAEFGAHFASVVMGALQGGGNVFMAAASSLGQTFTTHLAKTLTGGMGIAIEGALGGAINAILPGLGSLIGPLLGKIAGLFKKESMKVNDMRDEFLAQFGGGGTGAGSGFAELARQLHEATGSGELFQRVINAKKIGDFEAAMRAANDALAAHKQRQEEAARSAEVAAEKTTAAQNEATAAIRTRLDAVNKEFEELQKFVSSEAPEEEMGVMERQARERMEVLHKERLNLEQELKDALESLADVKVGPIEIPYIYVPQNELPGSVDARAMAGSVIGSARAAARSMGAALSRVTGVGEQTIVVELDGQPLLRTVARGLPRHLRLKGLGF